MTVVRVGVWGAGATGARTARQLLASPGVEEVLVADVDRRRTDHVVSWLGHRARPWPADDVEGLADRVRCVVLAHPVGEHGATVRRVLSRNRSVVSLSDDPAEVASLLRLDAEARERGVHVLVGAGFSPGVTCLLASYGARQFDVVDEVHVAKLGTGGPACARQHHRALRGWATDWRDGRWMRRPAGSGRELLWFPGPVGAADCYRARLPEPLLLVAVFRDVVRVTARMAATRRDRLTAPAPMLRRPHPEGRVGAVRVELRGWRGASRHVEVLGASERPAVAAGAAAAVAAIRVGTDRGGEPGVRGLGGLPGGRALLEELRGRGIQLAVFEGARNSE